MSAYFIVYAEKRKIINSTYRVKSRDGINAEWIDDTP